MIIEKTTSGYVGRLWFQRSEIFGFSRDEVIKDLLRYLEYLEAF